MVVLDKLAVRLSAVNSHNDSWIDNVRRDFRGIYSAITYRPTQQTLITVMAEHDRTAAVLSQGMMIDAFSRPNTTTLGAVGYLYNTALGTGYRAQGRVISTGAGIVVVDPDLIPKRTQTNGPNATYNNATTSVTLEVNQDIGKNLHLQLSGNFYQQNLESWGASARNITRDRSPLLANGQANPYFNELYTEYFRTHAYNGNTVRDIRFSAVYDLNFNWMKQQFIANVQQHQDSPGQKKAKYAEYLDPTNPNWVGTINPAITQGIGHVLGSIAPGKLADLVLWEPAFFGAKPKMVIKGGMINWASMGDPNASLPTPQPMLYRPMFGAFGDALHRSCITFTSKAAHDSGLAERFGLRRKVMPVYGTRTLTKRDMVRNDTLAKIEVDPQTFAVKVNGQHATAPPAKKLALNQLYFFS